MLEKGLIIKDDSTRLIGSFNDDGAYGYCHFLKLGKYYDEGTYVKDYLNGAKNLSINIDKKTVYFGQMIGEAEFTGKAWFASSSNDLYNGDYLDGKFTGSGWRIDKTGYQVKGTWDDGNIKTITSILNNKGETVNLKPKTLSEALSIAYNAYPGEFLGIQGNDNYGDDYDWLELFYESMINFPGTSATDLIASDYDEYWYYVATYAQTEGFDEAKAKYNELCKQVAAATITFKKGANPAKLTGDIKAADEETDFILTEFELPASINDPNDFGVSVVLKKNIDDKYIVMIVCGDNYGVSNWEE